VPCLLDSETIIMIIICLFFFLAHATLAAERGSPSIPIHHPSTNQHTA